ncbi:uncharacterized protein V6R79_024632 [Siganus canaliculatus]
MLRGWSVALLVALLCWMTAALQVIEGPDVCNFDLEQTPPMILSSPSTLILDLTKHFEKHNTTKQTGLCHRQHGASLSLIVISELQRRESAHFRNASTQ